MSPDSKTVLFARNHNLYMMDAESYAKALKNPNDTTIIEVQLTTDGEDTYGFSSRSGGRGNQDDQQQQQQQDDEQQQEQREDVDAKNARVAAVATVWSRDSSKFALVRRDVRLVKDLWVINPLANPRPTLETYRYAMPGEENTPQSEIFVFDVKSRTRVKIKADRFQDQTVNIATKPQRPVAGAGRGGGGGGGAAGPQTPPRPQEWLYEGSDKLYFTRLSRDMHRLEGDDAGLGQGDDRDRVVHRAAGQSGIDRFSLAVVVEHVGLALEEVVPHPGSGRPDEVAIDAGDGASRQSLADRGAVSLAAHDAADQVALGTVE